MRVVRCFAGPLRAPVCCDSGLILRRAAGVHIVMPAQDTFWTEVRSKEMEEHLLRLAGRYAGVLRGLLEWADAIKKGYDHAHSHARRGSCFSPPELR